MSEGELQEAHGEDDQVTTLSVKLLIPSLDSHVPIQLDAGTTTTFCGANGSGKTRLAAYIERELNLTAHRISAHRVLSLNPRVAKITEEDALSGLRTGYSDSSRVRNPLPLRRTNRWQEQEAVALLNDFDYLLQALFAEQMKITLQSHKKLRSRDYGDPQLTKFEKLSKIWERLIPHRSLVINGDDINVRVPRVDSTYSASEMSDGERAIFYLIGQTLVADSDSVLIIDEPELHLHPSIMTKLWDELSAERPDCAFVFITHSLEFSASRPDAKFIIHRFDPTPTWTLERVPKHMGFNEEFTTLILGTRRPVLFVEGAHSSLDRIIFRSSFPDYFLVPLGSCKDVIHAVASMRSNPALTRITCHGIVDRDHRSPDEIEHLRSLGVDVLPVAEIENIVLLPEVSRTIANHEGYKGRELSERLDDLRKAVFDVLATRGEREAAVVRYTARRIDNSFKSVDVNDVESVRDLKQLYNSWMDSLDIEDFSSEAERKIQDAIDKMDLVSLLENYDNKGLFALAAMHLKNTKPKSFEAWLERVLDNGSVPKLQKAIRKNLPLIPKPPRQHST